MIDPASGIRADGQLASTRYNDFPNLRWLGNRPGTTPLFADDQSGKWFCIEAHARLNTPGRSDGVFEYWIDDQLQVRSENLNWHGSWNQEPENPMINAVFFENYWNAGSPKTQERYFDNIVISTGRIGCTCPPADTDGDGISDNVERQSSLFQWDVDDRYVDSDGDGMSNASEYRAGTDPAEKESRLEIARIELIENRLALWLKTPVERPVAVEQADDPSAMSWDEAPQSGLTHGTGNSVERIELSHLSHDTRFFRLRIR